MDYRPILLVPMLLTIVCACQRRDEAVDASSGEGPAAATSQSAADRAGEYVEIVPGLTARTLRNGYGRAAEAGDLAEVHYTGWLYDEDAPDHRGTKFDSSVDRGQRFSFPLGAGRVIRGWDQGVQGMLIGETRELTIAPEMAYGDRGAGDVIPPGATLVFEVELFSLTGPDGSE
jgi:FKBP-type peptidyl-prolyl cis-trans isomerase FkpA